MRCSSATSSSVARIQVSLSRLIILLTRNKECRAKTNSWLTVTLTLTHSRKVLISFVFIIISRLRVLRLFLFCFARRWRRRFLATLCNEILAARRRREGNSTTDVKNSVKENTRSVTPLSSHDDSAHLSDLSSRNVLVGHKTLIPFVFTFHRQFRRVISFRARGTP